MIRKFTRFLNDESGAVTVDWVVLTAAVVGLTVAVFSVLTPQLVGGVGESISNGITAATTTSLGG